MSVYYLTHTVEFNTPVTEQVRIELYKKDIVPDAVTELKGTYARRQVLNGSGNGADTILSAELVFGLWLREDSGVDFDDFIVSFHDEWKVIFYCDGQIEFVGFITPNEGESSLIGIRKEINLSATDNLGLIKKAPLKRYNGDGFRSFDRIIDYILGALAQTGLQLNVIVYSNIYQTGQPDRNTDPTADTFNQYKLNYRTFLKDAIEFQDCYTALLEILTEGYTIEQWFGKWVIMRIGEMQGSEGPKIWQTEYTYDGTILSSGLVLNDPAIIMKDQTLHPIEGDLTISCNYSVKRAKHTFNYTPWPELPKNNTFERGTFLPGIGLPGQKAYSIDDWVYRVFNSTGQVATTDNAYRLSTYNIYGVETAREIILDSHFNDPQPGHRVLQCDPFPIKAGDRVEINFDFRRDPGGTGTMQYMRVSIVPTAGGNRYTLQNPNNPDGGGPFTWQHNAGALLSKFYQGENWQDWSSFSVECPSAPADGNFIIEFFNVDSAFTSALYRNFEVIYHPFVAGGYVEAIGDYWNTEQSASYLDDIDEEVSISDSEIKVLKGAIFLNDEVTLTSRSWHRLNVNENRGFKELINIARYNQSYRRMWKLSGTFGGIGYYPGNNQAIRQPLGFHKHFKFGDVPKVSGILFQLVPPLTIDYTEGTIKANLRESYTPGLGDGDQLGTIHEFKYKFK
jgi:hypothetical protein